MISLIIPTTSKNQTYTDNILNNINEVYFDKLKNGEIEVIVETNDDVTLGVNYNNAVARANGDKIILLHNDMIMKRGFIEQMDKDIVKNRITTYTRVEPPIFNDTYPGKVILDCGTDLDTFNSDKFNEFKLTHNVIDGGSQLFFGCMREDYIGIDGYTFKMFCEDDDLHRRYRLAGFDHKVSSAHVYHFVSKTSRSENTYQHIEFNSNRNYIRKWGARQEGPKYNIAYRVTNCTIEFLEFIEPWGDRIYIDDDMQVLTSHYIDKEQKNTSYDLNTRVLNTSYNDPEGENDIVVSVESTRFTEQDFMYIQQLPLIIQNSGEPGEFTLGNLHINIVSLIEYQNELISL